MELSITSSRYRCISFIIEVFIELHSYRTPPPNDLEVTGIVAKNLRWKVEFGHVNFDVEKDYEDLWKSLPVSTCGIRAKGIKQHYNSCDNHHSNSQQEEKERKKGRFKIRRKIRRKKQWLRFFVTKARRKKEDATMDANWRRKETVIPSKSVNQEVEK
ncbi:hypothetical protein Tco_1015447 [Tanacetum coccineum]|uniref:Uncharacterized protein n=1 Tax=Tanacetum coccineum TaxID=301880 RepID=A0ABQ5FNA5_9ASTR